ncbi:MAG: alpha/beta hydrolase [Chloroflexia bacterium]
MKKTLGAQLRRPRYLLLMLVVALLVAYLAVIRPMLTPSGGTSLVELAVVFILILAIALALLAAVVTLLIALVMAAIPRTRVRYRRWLRRSGRAVFTGLALIAVTLMVVQMTQWLAYRPPIRDANGESAVGSSATLEKFNLGGAEQWVTIRGKSTDSPVLLYLAGGPGGSELTKTRVHLGKLEDRFIVVNWDQPGAGKSYGAVPLKLITPERYVSDGHDLVMQLRERFDESKIYVFGDSWGSVLGILLVQRYPELFYAYIGTGQIVAFTENDTLCYEAALQLARRRGDTAKLEQLTGQGPPPYYGEGIVWKQAAYLIYLNDLMPGGGGDLVGDSLLAPEYGVWAGTSPAARSTRLARCTSTSGTWTYGSRPRSSTCLCTSSTGDRSITRCLSLWWSTTNCSMRPTRS